MQHPLWTFLRLVWSEWASLVTGSLSAVLVLLGLGISLAGTFGVQIPAASLIQLATWLLVAACGGQAAYAVWSKEYKARLTAEAKLSHSYGLSFGFDVAHDETNSDNEVEIRPVITNVASIPLSWYLTALSVDILGKRIARDNRGPHIIRPGQSMVWYFDEGLSHPEYLGLSRETHARVNYEIAYGLPDNNPDRVAKGDVTVRFFKNLQTGKISPVTYIVNAQSDSSI
jgi:hypothetical protein